jgi:hypothetical protein
MSMACGAGGKSCKSRNRSSDAGSHGVWPNANEALGKRQRTRGSARRV